MLKSKLTRVRSIKKECETRLEKLEKEKAKLERKKKKYDNKVHLTTNELQKLKEIEKQINELTVLRYQALVKCEQIAENIFNISQSQSINTVVPSQSSTTLQTHPPPPPYTPTQTQKTDIILPSKSKSIEDIYKEHENINKKNKYFLNSIIGSYQEKPPKDYTLIDEYIKKNNEGKINEAINYITSGKMKSDLKMQKLNEIQSQRDIQTMIETKKIKDQLDIIDKELIESIENADNFIKLKLPLDEKILDDNFYKYETSIQKFNKLKDSLGHLSSFSYSDQQIITRIIANIEILKDKIRIIKNNQEILHNDEPFITTPLIDKVEISTQTDEDDEQSPRTPIRIVPPNSASSSRVLSSAPTITKSVSVINKNVSPQKSDTGSDIKSQNTQTSSIKTLLEGSPTKAFKK